MIYFNLLSDLLNMFRKIPKSLKIFFINTLFHEWNFYNSCNNNMYYWEFFKILSYPKITRNAYLLHQLVTSMFQIVGSNQPFKSFMGLWVFEVSRFTQSKIQKITLTLLNNNVIMLYCIILKIKSNGDRIWNLPTGCTQGLLI